MGKRSASSKATRGVSKAKKYIKSSSSNPTTNKFRSQVKSLAAIAKGGISKKPRDERSKKKLANAGESSSKSGNVKMGHRKKSKKDKSSHKEAEDTE